LIAVFGINASVAKKACHTSEEWLICPQAREYLAGYLMLTEKDKYIKTLPTVTL
jgi:hypothetical protein